VVRPQIHALGPDNSGESSHTIRFNVTLCRYSRSAIMTEEAYGL
jgi:hypothetical protein